MVTCEKTVTFAVLAEDVEEVKRIAPLHAGDHAEDAGEVWRPVGGPHEVYRRSQLLEGYGPGDLDYCSPVSSPATEKPLNEVLDELGIKE